MLFFDTILCYGGFEFVLCCRFDFSKRATHPIIHQIPFGMIFLCRDNMNKQNEIAIRGMKSEISCKLLTMDGSTCVELSQFVFAGLWFHDSLGCSR